MIPYNLQDIHTIDDMVKEYPCLSDMALLGNKTVKQLIKEELVDLIDTAHDNDIFEGDKAKPDSFYSRICMPCAQARGLYHYFWSMEHVTSQMVKWGWKATDINLLIRRMQKAGYDPYSITEDTAGQFIERLPGHGCKTIRTKYGEEFTVYDPR